MSSAFLPIEALSNADKPRNCAARRPGRVLRQGYNVEYFTLPSRSLLNRCVSKREMPFTWAINPYRGCEFACKYCYARYTHEFMEMRDGVDFERKIYVKQQAAWLLRHELRRVNRARRSRSARRPILTSLPNGVTRSRAEFEEMARHVDSARHRDQVESGGPRSRPVAGGGEANGFRSYHDHDAGRGSCPDSRAARAATGFAAGCGSHVGESWLAGRCELLAGDSGNHRLS